MSRPGPAPSAEQLVVHVLTGEARGKRVQVGARVRIGRAQDNDVVLPDATVADHHSELELREGRLVLRDLGSGAGTRIGQATIREAFLKAGVSFSLGDADLMVTAPGASPERADLAFEPGKSYRETRAGFEADFERRYVSWLLGRHNGNISAAAREAKMDRKHLYDLARKHGLRGERSAGSR